MRAVLAIAFLCVLAACANGAQRAGEVDYRCTTDADCAIKDVGNCCGAYPACVNRESPTFPEAVKAECARKNMMSVCGFPTVTACACAAGRCTDVRELDGAGQ